MVQMGDAKEPSTPPLGLSTIGITPAGTRWPRAHCVACKAGTSILVYGQDVDGLVLCRSCRAPLLFCDLGGES